jgi:hypothetical protein
VGGAILGKKIFVQLRTGGTYNRRRKKKCIEKKRKL